jgi:uncharacterized protein YoxC
MPRQQTEATAHLNIYRLLVEKNRLQQELQNLDQRRQEILTRLAAVDASVANLEQTAEQLGQQTPQNPAPARTAFKPAARQDEFDLVFLEY